MSDVQPISNDAPWGNIDKNCPKIALEQMPITSSALKLLFDEGDRTRFYEHVPGSYHSIGSAKYEWNNEAMPVFGNVTVRNDFKRKDILGPRFRKISISFEMDDFLDIFTIQNELPYSILSYSCERENWWTITVCLSESVSKWQMQEIGDKIKELYRCRILMIGHRAHSFRTRYASGQKRDLCDHVGNIFWKLDRFQLMYFPDEYHLISDHTKEKLESAIYNVKNRIEYSSLREELNSFALDDSQLLPSIDSIPNPNVWLKRKKLDLSKVRYTSEIIERYEFEPSWLNCEKTLHQHRYDKKYQDYYLEEDKETALEKK